LIERAPRALFLQVVEDSMLAGLTKVRTAPSWQPRDRRPEWSNRVYAICFDLDTEALQKFYRAASWQNGYQDIARVLSRHGFCRQQGSVYFGDRTVDPVRCVLAIQDVASECAWFSQVVRDVRMLRIEENNDLLPAIEGLTNPSSQSSYQSFAP
jgi:virulence-associated protein VapD